MPSKFQTYIHKFQGRILELAKLLIRCEYRLRIFSEMHGLAHPCTLCREAAGECAVSKGGDKPREEDRVQEVEFRLDVVITIRKKKTIKQQEIHSKGKSFCWIYYMTQPGKRFA